MTYIKTALTFSLRSDWFRDDRAWPGGLVPLQAEEQRVGGPEPGGERRGVRLRVRHRHRRRRAGPGDRRARRSVSVLREQRRGRQPPPQTAVTHLARVLRERLGDSGPQRVGGERGGGGERRGGGPNRRLRLQAGDAHHRAAAVRQRSGSRPGSGVRSGGGPVRPAARHLHQGNTWEHSL